MLARSSRPELSQRTAPVRRAHCRQAKVLAKGIIDDLDLKVIRQCEYGAGFMKKCKMSPDAYLQMALQMAYFRDQGHFDLTYEASMTRLYRNGRTETVRSLSSEAAAFVRAMHAEPVDGEPAPSPVLLVGLLRAAGVRHQQAYRDAMVGKFGHPATPLAHATNRRTRY